MPLYWAGLALPGSNLLLDNNDEEHTVAPEGDLQAGRYLAIDNGVEWQTTWGYEVDQAGSGAWPMGALRWGPDMPDSGTSRSQLDNMQGRIANLETYQNWCGEYVQESAFRVGNLRHRVATNAAAVREEVASLRSEITALRQDVQELQQQRVHDVQRVATLECTLQQLNVSAGLPAGLPAVPSGGAPGAAVPMQRSCRPFGSTILAAVPFVLCAIAALSRARL